ncbi:MAG TPA: hypothetical protein PKX17_01450 [Candidatus Methanomethylicus sp.]|nr:hypothetical protein [Candidatus Methanomethylicus sp.]
MDQNIEAVLSMAIFLLVFSAANYVCIATYAASIDSKLDYTLRHYASIVAGELLLNSSDSVDYWRSLVPSDDPSLYGLPETVRLWINTTCISINDLSEPETVWSSATSMPPAFRTGECIKMSEVAGGLAIVVIVRAW